MKLKPEVTHLSLKNIFLSLREGIVLAAHAGPRVPSGGVTLKRRCTYRPSVIYLIVNKSLSLDFHVSSDKKSKNKIWIFLQKILLLNFTFQKQIPFVFLMQQESVHEHPQVLAHLQHQSSITTPLLFPLALNTAHIRIYTLIRGVLTKLGTQRRQSESRTLPLRRRGIAHSSLQERHQVCRARVRRHTIFHNLPPLPEYSANILVPPHRQIPTRSGFLRGHLLVICAAKPRYTAAAAREHGRVLAPHLPTPGANVTSLFHKPREELFEVCKRRVLLPCIEGVVRQVQF